MDFAVIVGIFICFALMIAGIVLSGGNMRTFTSVDSFLIVAGGTIGSALAGISFRDGLKAIFAARDVLMPKKIDWKGTITLFTTLAGEARKNGVLSLQNRLADQENPIIKAGLQLIIDGADSDILVMVTGTKITLQKEADKLGERIFSTMGSIAPSFGMLGTVIGLVQVLANLSEPEKLGPGIAQAFITTFYGIVFAKMFFEPIANKINRNNRQKSRYYEMILTGLQTLQEGDNPFMVEEKLKAFCTEEDLQEKVPAKKGEQTEGGQAELQAEAS